MGKNCKLWSIIQMLIILLTRTGSWDSSLEKEGGVGEKKKKKSRWFPCPQVVSEDIIQMRYYDQSSHQNAEHNGKRFL